MSDFKDKIEKLEDLIKGLSLKIQPANKIVASTKAPKMEGAKPVTPKIDKIPGLEPGAKPKNAIKRAEQLNHKDPSITQAQESVKINKSTGQWKLQELGKPFKSEAQRRWMWSAADKGEVPKDMPHEFAAATPKDKKLPYKVEKEEKPKPYNPDSLYHIHEGPHRLTSKPITLTEINTRHGGVKKLEGAGYRLHPADMNKSDEKKFKGIPMPKYHLYHTSSKYPLTEKPMTEKEILDNFGGEHKNMDKIKAAGHRLERVFDKE